MAVLVPAWDEAKVIAPTLRATSALDSCSCYVLKETMPLVRIDKEEKRRVVDVALAAARVQSTRSKSKVSPEEAMHLALGRYTLLRSALDHELAAGVVTYPDEIADS